MLRPLLWRSSDIRPRIRCESVSVRHLDLRKGRLVQHVVFADDAVQEEHVGRRRIHLVGHHRAGMIEWHRTIDVIPERRRVGPVAADGFLRPRRRQRSLTAGQYILRTLLAGWPVTWLA